MTINPIRRPIYYIAIASLLLAACGGGSSKQADQPSEPEEPGIMDAVSGVGKLTKAVSRMGDIESLQKKLQEMEPISRETLREVLPERLLGLKRSKLKLGEGQMLDINNGSADYADEAAGKELSLSITDGAGETGSALILTSLYALSMDVEEETETGFKRTGELEGYRASFEQSADYDGNPESEITFLVEDRFLVSLKGKNMDVETLKGAVSEISLDKLK